MTSAVPPSPARGVGSREGGTGAGLTLIFFLLTGIGIAHHEMWRDELQAWMLARDSGSIPELLHNMRYEGHPPAWHLALFLLSRFTRDPLAMQLLHLALATTVVYLIARCSPFSRAQRALLAFGYFFSYEYAVISRGYVLGVLALFAFCALYPMRRRSFLPLAAALILLANTSVYGLLLAIAAGATLLLEWLIDPELRRSLWRHRRAVAVSTLLCAVGGIASLLQMLPPAGAWTGRPLAEAARWSDARIGASLSLLWHAYVPLPGPSTPGGWGTNVFDGVSLHYGLPLLLSVLLGLAAILLFLRRPLPLFLFSAGTAAILLFAYLKFHGGIRHHGHLFVLFIASLWLARLSPREWRLPRPLDRLAARSERWGNSLVVGLLVAQVVAGATVYLQDLRHPFSAAKAAADFIERNGLRELPIAGRPRHLVSTIAGYLDREIYDLDRGSSGTFVVWGMRRGATRDPSELVSAARPRWLLIRRWPLPDRPEGLAVRELARFTHSIVPDERYYLYLLELDPHPAADRAGE